MEEWVVAGFTGAAALNEAVSNTVAIVNKGGLMEKASSE